MAIRKPREFVSWKNGMILSWEGQGTFVFLCQSWISCLSDHSEEKKDVLHESSEDCNSKTVT